MMYMRRERARVAYFECCLLAMSLSVFRNPKQEMKYWEDLVLLLLLLVLFHISLLAFESCHLEVAPLLILPNPLPRSLPKREARIVRRRGLEPLIFAV